MASRARTRRARFARAFRGDARSLGRSAFGRSARAGRGKTPRRRRRRRRRSASERGSARGGARRGPIAVARALGCDDDTSDRDE
jgi:hypothetical protein